MRRPTSRTARCALAAALPALVAMACSRLPAYAQPQVEVVDAAKLAHADAIPYRALTRDDFRASNPPVDTGGHTGRMSAYTCANVVPHGDQLVQVAREGASGPYVARARSLAFVARMDRRCSWWNPDQGGVPREYVLEHEQIHFAIAELAARDLTARVRRLAATGSTPAAATAAFQRALDAAFGEAMEHMKARSTQLDLDTSGRRDAAAQHRWREQVEAELAHPR